jgi:MerR family redox-sensitive transcriptional activator SoxR
MEILRAELARCVGCGCLSVDTCKLFYNCDTVSEEGRGRRRLLVGDATRP